MICVIGEKVHTKPVFFYLLQKLNKSWILNTFKDPEDMIVKVNLSSAKKERKMIQIFSQKEL